MITSTFFSVSITITNFKNIVSGAGLFIVFFRMLGTFSQKDRSIFFSSGA
jgi:hypothetical protein